MCVIAFSPKGVDIPSEYQMREMWETNPDGAGYAYVDNRGEVVFRKGFMKLADLLDELKDRERFKNTNFAVHFRIGTSGNNDKATCHPFPVSNNFGDLRKTEGRGGAVLFHNGVLDKGGLCDPLSSDTQDFVVATYPLLKKYNKSKTRDHFIEKLIEGNRVLVLYKDNKFKMFGTWQKDGDLWVSNTHYKYMGYSYGYGGYSSGCYGGGWLDDDYEHDRATAEALSEDEDEDEDEDTLHLPRYATSNFNQKMTSEAVELWNKVIRNEFAYLTLDEIKVMRDSSEMYCQDYFTANGYKVGVDLNFGLVWLEDTPPYAKALEEQGGQTKLTEQEQVELYLESEATAK